MDRSARLPQVGLERWPAVAAGDRLGDEAEVLDEEAVQEVLAVDGELPPLGHLDTADAQLRRLQEVRHAEPLGDDGRELGQVGDVQRPAHQMLLGTQFRSPLVIFRGGDQLFKLQV
jgi:hypothetical protein